MVKLSIFQKEREIGHSLLSIHKPIERTVAALQISRMTFNSIRKWESKAENFKTQQKVKYSDFDMSENSTKVIVFCER